METSLERTERTWVKLIMGGLAAFLAFVLLCWGGVRFYHHWQEGHLVRRAAAFMSGGDFKAASLSARRALQLNPSSAEAARVLAQIGEKIADRSALDWRRKVVELQPQSTDDALALVRCAMWFNDLATAQKTLNNLGEAARQKPEFYAASGRLAEMQQDLATAEGDWAKAAALAPNEPAYRFQLALIQVRASDAQKREGALRELENLRSVPEQRTAATRALILDGVAHRSDPQRLRSLAEALQGYPDATFQDRLLYLEILRQLHDPAYEEYLAQLTNETRTQPVNAAGLLSWMVRTKMSAEALAFAQALPAEAAAKWPVPAAIAEAYAQMKDWSALRSFLGGSNWQSYDFLRHAYLARVFRGQGNKLAAEQELRAAEKEAFASPQLLSMLTQTIADWGWENETIELLWEATKIPETRMQALETLYKHYSQVGDTSGIYRALTKFAEIRPDDAPLQNNLAQVSLLLGLDVEHASKVAAELARNEPANAAYVSTFAFSLYSKGELKHALEVMDALTPEQLRESSIATYYGVLLAAAGEKEKARDFLARSRDAALLPEEKALVAKAESALR